MSALDMGKRRRTAHKAVSSMCVCEKPQLLRMWEQPLRSHEAERRAAQGTRLTHCILMPLRPMTVCSSFVPWAGSRPITYLRHELADFDTQHYTPLATGNSPINPVCVTWPRIRSTVICVLGSKPEEPEELPGERESKTRQATKQIDWICFVPRSVHHNLPTRCWTLFFNVPIP